MQRFLSLSFLYSWKNISEINIPLEVRGKSLLNYYIKIFVEVYGALLGFIGQVYEIFYKVIM